MTDTAFQTKYRQEYIAGFEDRQTRLRSSVTTEANINGNNAVFLVADSGSATAVTRGSNGMIAARADNNTQLTCPLAEWHDLVRKTKFNIYASQGDQRRIMQNTSLGVINRKIDDDIIAQLDTATNDTGSAVPATIDLVIKAKVILGNNFIPTEEEDNMYGLVTPAFMGYLQQAPEFSSADYVEMKPFTGPTRKFRRWLGVNWIEHPRLTGVGTSAEKCYLYHRNAIGHAMDTANLDAQVGYDAEQSYSWARTSGFWGSKLLQNSGVVQMNHDGSGFVAS